MLAQVLADLFLIHECFADVGTVLDGSLLARVYFADICTGLQYLLLWLDWMCIPRVQFSNLFGSIGGKHSLLSDGQIAMLNTVGFIWQLSQRIKQHSPPASSAPAITQQASNSIAANSPPPPMKITVQALLPVPNIAMWVLESLQLNTAHTRLCQQNLHKEIMFPADATIHSISLHQREGGKQSDKKWCNIFLYICCASVDHFPWSMWKTFAWICSWMMWWRGRGLSGFCIHDNGDVLLHGLSSRCSLGYQWCYCHDCNNIEEGMKESTTFKVTNEYTICFGYSINQMGPLLQMRRTSYHCYRIMQVVGLSRCMLWRA